MGAVHGPALLAAALRQRRCWRFSAIRELLGRQVTCTTGEAYERPPRPATRFVPCPKWGAAFKLAGDEQQRQATLEYLEWRVRPAVCKQADGTCSQLLPCKPRDAAAAVCPTAGKLTAASRPSACASGTQEKQYDQRALVDVHTADGAVALQALTFIATGA